MGRALLKKKGGERELHNHSIAVKERKKNRDSFCAYRFQIWDGLIGFYR
jgi:hypothetical protein